ncbi:MAG: DNA-processing protein DprA [Bacillota bacterium]|nr:DNA-processing protein DprA [Bacillota bacterium]
MIKKIDLITLLQLNDVGSKTILKIYDYIENRRLIDLDFNDYIELLKEKFGRDYTKKDQEVAMLKAEKILENCYLKDIHIFSFLDEDYPEKFQKINYDKPVIFYSKGNHRIMTDKYNLAIIGSRRIDKKNYRIGYKFSKEIASLGINIISGLALGSDTAGHKGSLSIKNSNNTGKTLAVLPSGIENIYPYENKALSREIIENSGCLISEKSPYEMPEKYDYIMRDRLQSALSEGIFIIQSRLNSGTQHTVNYGIKYSKKIYCLGINIENKGMELNRKLIEENKAFRINSEEEFIKVILKERDEHNEISHQ